MSYPVRTATISKDLSSALPRVIAISSGKGGVGKSSIAVNLGISLARQGKKVCLLDADTGLANVNILLGIQPQYSLEHVLYGTKAIDEIMLTGPFGLKVIPGASGISETVSLHPRQQLRLTRELSRIEKEFDYLLIDTAAGIAETTLDFISAAQYALVVITPEPTSLTDAFSLIKLLKRRRGQINFRVVVNMSDGASDGVAIFNRFASAVEKYIGVDLEYLGYLPRDESVRAAVSLQNPVAMFPDTDPSCRSFLRLAQSIVDSTKNMPTSRSFSAYWYSQFKHFEEKERDKSGEPVLVPDSELGEQQKENEYLAELQARLLLMIDKGLADSELIGKLLGECVSSYINTFEQVPFDVVRLVEEVILSPARDDYQLREIYSKVKPWGEIEASEASTVFVEPAEAEMMASEPFVGPDTVVNAALMGGEPVDQPLTGSVGQYDTARFGSQDKLLTAIQNQQGSLVNLVTILENHEG
ncbi:MAG: MinD-like ATPase involved in chromosome partitioning or flagellar assembly [Pseudohongiellaceae bacterium]|jgi:MinD-like ATPase involved in chromosome partitioning or flagellar assembly